MSESGESGTPSSPTEVLSANRPATFSSESSVAAVIVPVRFEIRRNDTLAESPGAMLSMPFVVSSSRRAPLMFCAKRLRLTKFAGDSVVFVTVTSSVYGSPALTMSGCVKVSVNFGLRTSTAPAARPRIGTGPIGRPLRVPASSISTTCVPSRRPSTRNSALPVCAGPSVVMSSPVPSCPSAPACVTGTRRADSPVARFAIRSGSSCEPTTLSMPGGRTMLAVSSDTTRFDPSGATLATISMTLKNWLRNPMSPGMTMTPGMGGTTKSWPLG